MNKIGFEFQPNLVRLALGIPVAGLGGAIGYATAPKEHRLSGMARGAGIGYMAGTGAGVGMLAGDTFAPTENTANQKLPYILAGGLGGGALGLGAGGMMYGPSKWEEQRKFKEDLMRVLYDEQDKLRKEFRNTSLSKIGEAPQLAQFAEEHPELIALPVGGAIGASFADKKKHPVKDTLRGMLTGLATGAGVAGGGAVGRNVTADPATGTIGGGAIGGLFAYLASRQRHEEKVAVGPALAQLLQAKELSDRKDYKGKHTRLRSLIEKYPDDFFIDSVNGDIAGITHRPTNFQIHAPLRVLPVRLRGFSDVTAAV